MRYQFFIVAFILAIIGGSLASPVSSYEIGTRDPSDVVISTQPSTGKMNQNTENSTTNHGISTPHNASTLQPITKPDNSSNSTVTAHTVQPITKPGNSSHSTVTAHTVQPITKPGNSSNSTVTAHTVQPITKPGNSTAHSIKTIATRPSSSGDSGSSFDVGSFFGGVALVLGLVIIVGIAYKCYARRTSQGYNAM